MSDLDEAAILLDAARRRYDLRPSAANELRLIEAERDYWMAMADHERGLREAALARQFSRHRANGDAP